MPEKAKLRKKGNSIFVPPPPRHARHVVTRTRLAYKLATSRKKRGFLQIPATPLSLATCVSCQPHREQAKRPDRPGASQESNHPDSESGDFGVLSA